MRLAARRKPTQGFTIIELCASVLGAAVLGAMTLTLYTTTVNSVEVASVKTQVTSDLRNAFEQIGRDFHASRATVASCVGPPPIVPVVVGTQQLRIILDHPEGGGFFQFQGWIPTTRLIYQCSADNACTPTNPGTLQRVVRDLNCGGVYETRTLARGVTALDLREVTTGGRPYIKVTLGLRGQVRPQGFAYTDQLTDLFTLRAR